MARTTISIPDDLKARMDAVEARVNWSGIAAQAFEDELNWREHMSETLESPREYILELEDEDGTGYRGRLTGAQLLSGDGFDVYLTDDERVMLHDKGKAKVRKLEDPEEDLAGVLYENDYLITMKALGIKVIVDL